MYGATAAAQSSGNITITHHCRLAECKIARQLLVAGRLV